MCSKWTRLIVFLIWMGLLIIGLHSEQPVKAVKRSATGITNNTFFEGVKLKAALIGGGTYESLYESIHKFEQETGAKVEIIFKDNNFNLDKKLKNDFTANKIDYDVISTHSSQFPGYADALVSLEYLFTEDELRDFSPSILNAGEIDSRLYMIPRLADIGVYYYRTDLFYDETNRSKFKSEYHYDLAPPRTLEQLKDISIFFAKQGTDLSGTQFAGKEEALSGRFMELTQAFGGDFFDDKRNVIINQSGGLRAAQYLRDLYVAGAMPKGVIDFLWDEVENNFANGKIAIYSDWPGWYSTLDDPKSSKVAGKFDVIRAPEGPSGIHPGWGGVHGFAITKASKNKQAAAALIKFLTNAENMTNESKLGATPVRLSVWDQVLNDAKKGDQRKQNFYNTLNIALKEDFRTPPPIKQWIPLSNILYPYLQKIIIGDMSPKEGLDAAAKGITEMMNQTK